VEFGRGVAAAKRLVSVPRHRQINQLQTSESKDLFQFVPDQNLGPAEVFLSDISIEAGSH